MEQFKTMIIIMMRIYTSLVFVRVRSDETRNQKICLPWISYITIPMLLFIAFGTRGDVQPLATLAEHLRQKKKRVRLVTHAPHVSSWLSLQPWNKLETIPVSSSPFVRADEDQLACWEALQKCQMTSQISLIIFNLFALEVRASLISSGNMS